MEPLVLSDIKKGCQECRDKSELFPTFSNVKSFDQVNEAPPSKSSSANSVCCM